MYACAGNMQNHNLSSKAAEAVSAPHELESLELKNEGDIMQKRTLGKKLEVSALGLGCMGMSFSYAPFPDKKDMISLLQMCIRDRDTGELQGRSLATDAWRYWYDSWRI